MFGIKRKPSIEEYEKLQFDLNEQKKKYDYLFTRYEEETHRNHDLIIERDEILKEKHLIFEKLNNVCEELKSSLKKNDFLEDFNASLSKRIKTVSDDYKNQIDDLTTEIIGIRKQLLNEKKISELLNQQIENEQIISNNLECKIKDEEKINGDLKIQIRKLNSYVSEKNILVEQQIQKISSLCDRIYYLENDLKEQCELNESLKQQTESTSKINKEFEIKINRMKYSISARDNLIGRQNSEIESLKRDILHRNILINDKSIEIQKLHEQLTNQKNSIESIQNKNVILDDECSELRIKLEESWNIGNKQSEEYDKNISELLNKNKNLIEQNNAIMKDNLLLLEKTEKMKSEISDKISLINEISSEKEELIKKESELTEELSDLKTAYILLKNKIPEYDPDDEFEELQLKYEKLHEEHIKLLKFYDEFIEKRKVNVQFSEELKKTNSVLQKKISYYEKLIKKEKNKNHRNISSFMRYTSKYQAAFNDAYMKATSLNELFCQIRSRMFIEENNYGVYRGMMLDCIELENEISILRLYVQNMKVFLMELSKQVTEDRKTDSNVRYNGHVLYVYSKDIQRAIFDAQNSELEFSNIISSIYGAKTVYFLSKSDREIKNYLSRL